MRTLSYATVAAALAMASPARAQSVVAPRASEAEALFREAKDLIGANRVAEACPKFQQSHRLDPQLGTLLHLAACHQVQGRTASAWVEFNEAAATAARTNQPEREALARARASELERVLSRCIIELPANQSSTMTVKLDGEVIAPAIVGSPMPVDPGRHVVEVTAPKKKAWPHAFEIAATRQTTTLTVPLLEDDASARDTAPATPPSLDARAAPGEPGASRTAGWIVAGVGVAALGVGGYFGLRAAGQRDDADQNCAGRYCTEAGLAGHERAKDSALVSTVAMAVGAAAVGVGLALVFWPAPAATTVAHPRAPSVERVVVGVSPAGAHAVVRW